MVAKKQSSTKSAKSSSRSSSKKTSAKTSSVAKTSRIASSKAPAKSSVGAKTPAKKSVCATEPYHPLFGVILLVVAAIIVAFLLGSAVIDFSRGNISKNSDAFRFASEYSSVERENVFVYKTNKEAVEFLESGTGLIFFGFPNCPWCQAYAPMLNSFAKEKGLTSVAYFNIYDDWQANSPEYQKLTELLGDSLQFDNVGNRHLYVPDVAFVVEGEIVANDWETSKDTLGLESPEEYWTEERTSAWKEKMSSLYEKYLEKLNSIK